MDRRAFIALVGGGVLGGAAGRLAATPDHEAPVDEGPLEGQVALPTSGLQRIIWRVDTNAPALALTFDDGPDPEFTPGILELLDRHGLKATFFSMGFNANEHASLLREVVAAGHEIGSHGWAHLNLTRISPTETYEEIEAGKKAVEDTVQVPVKLFRPPYGRFDEAAVRFLASKRDDMIVWSLTRGELTWTDPEQIATHIATMASPGEILMLHDGIGRATFNRESERSIRVHGRRKIEQGALPEILDRIQDKGLKPVTVSRLIAKAIPEETGA